MSDFATFARSRRSIRRYTPQAIPDELLQNLLETAIWSPSAHNRQPWRFAIVREKSSQEHLARQMGARLRHDLAADGLMPEQIENDAARSYSRITGAAALVCLCLSMEDMDIYPDERRARNEFLMAAQSTAMAGQTFLLAAHAAGLGACWMCAPLFCPDVVSAALELPDTWHPQALITLGYPAEERAKERRSLAEVAVWR